MLTPDQSRILFAIAKLGPTNYGALAHELRWKFAFVHPQVTALIRLGLVDIGWRGCQLSTEGHRLVHNDREAIDLPDGETT